MLDGRLELSGIELGIIVRELNESLSSYYVGNVYPIDENTIVFRLHHSLRPEQRLVVSAGRGIWTTKYDLATERPSGLVSRMRKELVRGRLVRVEQPDTERIVFIDFEAMNGVRRLIAEFFGDGNLILTDENWKILDILRPLKVRHRELKKGASYSLPPSRGLDVYKLNMEDLKELRSSSLEVVRWLGRNLSLSKRYVEEVLRRSAIEPNKKGVELDEEQLKAIFTSIKDIISTFEAKKLEPVLLYDGDKPVDASPIALRSYDGLQPKPHESFHDAVDEVFTRELVEEKARVLAEPLKRRLAELEASLKEQERTKQKLEEDAKGLREVAKNVKELYMSGKWDVAELPKLLMNLGMEEVKVEEGKFKAKVADKTIELDFIPSPMKLSSYLYDLAKGVEEKLKAIESARSLILSKREDLLLKLRSKAEQQKKPEVKRERLWFERFRWFYTSDGLLAIGGRDASSNSAIIRKHTESSDLVFHADLHGSPFFVLKGGSSAKEQSIIEVCQAVVSFSSAWRDGLYSADAYWVKPEQVKKQAPSGMYLPKGSFLIEGRRNYLKNVSVKLAVGVMPIDDSPVLVSGPPSAIRNHTVAYVIIQPDDVKISDTAKQVKASLVGLVEGGLAEKLKRLSLDEFIRVLPSKGARIVSRERGQKD